MPASDSPVSPDEAIPACVVVLGMHRSGTSCLTRILAQAGLHLGDNLMLDPEAGNLLGHWESVPIVDVNDRILLESDGAWDRVPERLVASDKLHAEMDVCIDRLRRAPLYGWKDPRTTLTWPLWESHIHDETIYVICVRHPSSVAESLVRREGWTHERGMRLWFEYNRRLLPLVERNERIVWFPYGSAVADPASALRNVVSGVGLPFSDELLSLYNPILDHSGQNRGGVRDSDAHLLYEEFLTHAVRQISTRNESMNSASDVVSKSSVVINAKDGEELSIPRLADAVKRLIEVANQSNELNQIVQKRLSEIANQSNELNQIVQNRLGTFEARLAEHQESLQGELARQRSEQTQAEERQFLAVRRDEEFRASQEKLGEQLKELQAEVARLRQASHPVE